MTTLAGDFDLRFAIFIILGARKDEPSPARVKLIQRTINTKILFVSPSKCTVAKPHRNEIPESRAPEVIKDCIANFLNNL